MLKGTIPGIITQHFKTKEEPKASLASQLSVKGGDTPKAVRVEASEENLIMEPVISSGHTEGFTAASVKSLFQTLSTEGQDTCSRGDGQNGVEIALKNSFTSVTHFDDAVLLLELSPNDALCIMEPSLQLENNTVLKRQEVLNVVFSYFSKLGDMLPNTSSRVLQSANLRDRNRQFQRTTTQTENRYAVHVAQLLIFAHRSAFMPFGSSIDLSLVLVLFENWKQEKGGAVLRQHHLKHLQNGSIMR